MKKTVNGQEEEIKYLVGKSNSGWISCVLEEGTEAELGGALLALFEHSALKKVALLSSDEWLEHMASQKTVGWSHIDRGVEVTHCLF